MKIKENIVHFIDGFFMAMADSVPGVSGGTIAFLLDFYDAFIKSLDDLFFGDMKKKKVALIYLIKLGIGWVVGFLLSATILSSLFESKIYMMCSLFLGFIIAAIPYIIKEEKDCLKGKLKNIIYAIIGAIIVILITLIMNKNGININLDKLSLGTIIYIFICASIAISAMVLPGISGSTMLLVFGLYIPVMSAIKELLHFNFDVIPMLLIFILGIIFGIFTIVRLIRRCLEHHRSPLVYFIIGMMIASLYSICMGPLSVGKTEMLNFSNFNIIAFILGGALILVLEHFKKNFGVKK